MFDVTQFKELLTQFTALQNVSLTLHNLYNIEKLNLENSKIICCFYIPSLYIIGSSEVFKLTIKK